MSDSRIERQRDLAQRLERGFQEAQESERFAAYLRTAAKFHRYSFHNTMLIWIQRPDASHVAGFQTWKELGRYVRRGEKGIQILAPGRSRRRKDDEEEEPETVTYFFPVFVFDITQTEGEPLPSPVDDLAGDDGALWAKLDRLAQTEGLTVDRTEGRGNGASGYYRPDAGEIWVRPDSSPAMATKTLCHELAHYFSHDPALDCQEAETIAESAAYVVLGHFGIDSGDYSFGYLATWTDVKVFKGKLGVIHATAARIIDSIEGS